MADDSLPVSLFRRVAIGIAAEDKAIKTRTLKVVPHEDLSFLDGELRDNPTPIEYSGTDGDGRAYEGVMITDNVVEALWLPEGSNRVSPPDIRRGERVALYRYADNDQYYWKPLGLDDHLRRLETVTFAISANPDEANNSLDPESCYFVEVSSHTKTITIATSRKNGEAAAFTVQLNMDKGFVKLQDDQGNSFDFDAINLLFKFLLNLGTTIELNRDKIYAYAPQSIELNAVQQILAKSKEILIEGSSRVRITSGGTYQEWTPGATTLQTPQFIGKR